MSNVKVYIVNGYPRSGKDSFVDYCLKRLGAVGNKMSTVDEIKKFAKSLGWNGEKTPESRFYLSELKRITDDWLDASNYLIDQKIKFIKAEADAYGMNYDLFVLFIHCREPIKIKEIVKKYAAKTIFINREEKKLQSVSNESDACVEQISYDYTIENNGTLEELRKKAETFVENIIWEGKYRGY